MRGTERVLSSQRASPHVAPSWAAPSATSAAVGVPSRNEPPRFPEGSGESVRTHARGSKPVVLVDPDLTSLVTVWSLRRAAIPLHALSSRWLEPVLWARGVCRHHLPDLDAQPLTWSARLLELVARLEPRPLVIPCSRRARDLLRDSRAMLAPHYDLSHLDPLSLRNFESEDFRTEQALRRTVLRGEPAFEVQMTLDGEGTCTGCCVLAWVAGVPPLVLVSSVDGEDVLERSLQWLRERRLRGYARLIWAPDRFGRIELQAAGTLPGSGWILALEDGVDLPLLWFRSLTGIDGEPQHARRQLSRQFSLGKPGDHTETVPLVPLRLPWMRGDPLPPLARWLGRLWRR